MKENQNNQVRFKILMNVRKIKYIFLDQKSPKSKSETKIKNNIKKKYETKPWQLYFWK